MIYLSLSNNSGVYTGQITDTLKNPDSLAYADMSELRRYIDVDIERLMRERQDIPLIKFKKLMSSYHYLRLLKKYKYKYTIAIVNRLIKENEVSIAVVLKIITHTTEVKSVYLKFPYTNINVDETIELIIIKLMLQNKIPKIDKLYLRYPNARPLNVIANEQYLFEYEEYAQKDQIGEMILEIALMGDKGDVLEGYMKGGI